MKSVLPEGRAGWWRFAERRRSPGQCLFPGSDRGWREVLPGRKRVEPDGLAYPPCLTGCLAARIFGGSGQVASGCSARGLVIGAERSAGSRFGACSGQFVAGGADGDPGSFLGAAFSQVGSTPDT